MKSFLDILPPSKSNPHRALKYTPACRRVGVLELTDARSHVRYALAVLPFGGVRLTKSGGEENYTTTAESCECRGYVYGDGKPCKHIEAVRCLLAHDQIGPDELETVRDLHADAEEQDQWWNRGPDRLAEDWYAAALGGEIVTELGGA